MMHLPILRRIQIAFHLAIASLKGTPTSIESLIPSEITTAQKGEKTEAKTGVKTGVNKTKVINPNPKI